MKDEHKTKEQLIKELVELRQRVAELEAADTERKRAEEALRESEQWFSTTLRSIGDAVIATDAQGLVTLMNPVAEDLTGWDEAVAVGKPLEGVFDIINEQTGERAENPVARVLREGVVVGLANHTVLIAKDGMKRPIADSGAPMIDDAGNIIGTVMVFRDITERKRAEEALAHERDLLQALMDNIPDTIYFKDTTSRFTRINRAQAQVLGVSDPEETIGKADFDFFAPEHAQDAYADEQEIVKSGRPLIGKVERIRRANGQFRWVSATKVPIVDDEGRVTGIVGISRDITERKQAEEALRASEAKYRHLLENIPQKIFYKDRNTVYVVVNPSYARDFNIAPEDFVGKTDYDFFSRELADKYRADDKRIMQAGTAEDLDEQYLKDGEEFSVHTVKTPVFDDEGNAIGILGIFWDITERVRAEEALQKHSERLEEMVEERAKALQDAQEQLIRKEKLALLGQLAGGVGHELRNPLGVISNAVYYLKTVLTDADETTREFLDIISAEVRNSTKIISDLLDFSRTRLPDREEVAVSELVVEVLKKRPPSEEVEVIITQIASDLPLVYVDPQQMVQVLGNLVVNAYQAMKEGGNLTISAQAEEGQVTLSVADTGCGIPEENMTQLFQPLFTTRARGIGLGLAVSKSLVEANGGSIEVISEVGKGSTFTVRLPLAGGTR